ncbi:HNH endonuclease [Ensifer canadensis]|uniref:HNH endonuclease n=1 Tax=Ensifer canadensis TaxID=555315 RepID=UPI001CEF5696|nr:HNH endonuclease [Ensifer canadensis]
MGNWEDTRGLVLARDEYKCVSCAAKVKSRDADVHHLLPRSMGGSDELSNLVTRKRGFRHAKVWVLLALGAWLSALILAS